MQYFFKNKDITKAIQKGLYKLFDDKSKALEFSDQELSPCLTIAKQEKVLGVETVTFCWAVKLKKK